MTRKTILKLLADYQKPLLYQKLNLTQIIHYKFSHKKNADFQK